MVTRARSIPPLLRRGALDSTGWGVSRAKFLMILPAIAPRGEVPPEPHPNLYTRVPRPHYPT